MVQQPSAVKVGHASRGDSGALYLQSAIAGVVSVTEGFVCVVCDVLFCVEKRVLRNQNP